jgi:hypothetical protein
MLPISQERLTSLGLPLQGTKHVLVSRLKEAEAGAERAGKLRSHGSPAGTEDEGAGVLKKSKKLGAGPRRGGQKARGKTSRRAGEDEEAHGETSGSEDDLDTAEALLAGSLGVPSGLGIGSLRGYSGTAAVLPGTEGLHPASAAVSAAHGVAEPETQNLLDVCPWTDSAGLGPKVTPVKSVNPSASQPVLTAGARPTWFRPDSAVALCCSEPVSALFCPAFLVQNAQATTACTCHAGCGA